MGWLHYANSAEPIEIPDHVLAHVKVVAATKLRRHESFLLSWRFANEPTAGQESIWIHPSIPLRFVLDSAEGEEIDHTLLHQYAMDASTTKGLCLELESRVAVGGADRVHLVA